VQPEAAAARLRAALDALGVWPAGAAEQQALSDSLLRYLALLAKWNRTYNLTAVREPERMLVQHIFDCAAVALPLKARVQAQRDSQPMVDRRPLVVDVGSGAGLPGIVLALLWPEVDVLLVEPVGKKAAFLEQVRSELRLQNVSVARCRVQDLPALSAAPDAIVCRAFASVADFTQAVDRVAGPRTVVAAMKARLEQNEKSALTHGWRIVDELPLHVPELGAARHLVVLERTAHPK
jgi:16S rRNA (guanine527-N7)-methyltransferase